jgi:thymidine kinase
VTTKFPALNFNINYKYICGRDNYTCQNTSCNARLDENQVYFHRIDPNGEDIESNIVLSCNKCDEGIAMLGPLIFQQPLTSFSGRLIVITGPMYSQKSTTTKSFYNKYCAFSRLLNKKNNYAWIKPQIDDRKSGYTKTHDEDLIEAITIDSKRPDLSIPALKEYDIVAIDEAQFFSSRLVYVVQFLLKNGCLVIVNGLKLTARRDLFGVMPYLMAEADEIISLKAICNVCGLVDYATRTKSFDLNSPSVKTGGLEQYYAVCPTCDGGVDEEEFIKKFVQQEQL